MSAAPDSEKDEEEHGAERQATSMRDQLSKEVASWSKQRRQQPDEVVAAPKQAGAERPARRVAVAAKKPDASTVASKPAGAGSRPYSMSYDGQTQAEYIQYLRDRGLR